MSRGIEQFRRANARRLRTSATSAEQRLWKELRKIPVYGTHFRRQVPLGPYIADIACLWAKLVIEIDGSQHASEPVRSRDTERTRWLSAEGYRVLRFWNSDVLRDPSGVLEQIYSELHGGPAAESQVFTPPRRAARADPPPQGEGKDA